MSTKRRTVLCQSIQEIQNAIQSASPGDDIVIATTAANELEEEGSYCQLVCTANGTDDADGRITLRSEDSTNPAILRGHEDLAHGVVLKIKGDYWKIQDLKLTHAQKGIVVDSAKHTQIINCEVYGVGLEGIHPLNGACHTLIDKCKIHDTGLVKPGCGEGVYIGSDKSVWHTKYNPNVCHTTVRQCIFGPNITAEALDIKEGSSNTIIEFNTFDATGISGENYADSFIDAKGITTYIRYNQFHQNSGVKIKRGIASIHRGVEKSAQQHVIHDNQFYFTVEANNNIPIVEASGAETPSEICEWNNQVYIRTPQPKIGKHVTSLGNGDDTIDRPSWYYGVCDSQL